MNVTCSREQHDVLHARGCSRRQQRAQAAGADNRAHAPQRGRHCAFVACRTTTSCLVNCMVRLIEYERDRSPYYSVAASWSHVA